MNARFRMMADARSLFWPWCIVAATGILSTLSLPRLPGGLELDVVAGFGFAIGFPLLATLSFGNEFQFGTLSSLLSQPVERSRIWREKSVVIVVAVLSAAIAYGFGAHRMGWDTRGIIVAALWLMVTVGSSVYWTLLSRSTIGGLVLNGLQSMALLLIFIPQLNRSAESSVLLAIGGFATAYTAIMLYLGRRKLLQLQDTGSGSGSGSNVLATDWTETRGPLRKLLRCTASGGAMNLVRKELHLIWPLAPLTLITVGILLAVGAIRFVFGHESSMVTVGISVTLIHGALAAILSGALSLGEERTLGLHSWNLTQPISVRFQWAIKLGMAVFASAVCSGAVVLIAHLLFGPDFLEQFSAMFRSGRSRVVLAMFPLLAFVAFWCATAVKDTVRAAFWCLPAAIAVLVVYDFGMSVGTSASALEAVRTLTQSVHPFPFSSEFEALSSRLLWSVSNSVIPVLWVIAWLVPFAALQSYRLFRSEIREGIRPLIRQALLLAAVGFLSGFLQIVPAAASRTMHNNTAIALMEVARGISAMRVDPTAVSDTGYTVSLETISNSIALSNRTLSWFATDTLMIRPKAAVVRESWYEPMEETRYMITAELHGGWTCTFADNLFDERYGSGRMGAPRGDKYMMGVPRGANYMFVCRSKQGKLGWLETIP